MGKSFLTNKFGESWEVSSFKGLVIWERLLLVVGFVVVVVVVAVVVVVVVVVAAY